MNHVVIARFDNFRYPRIGIAHQVFEGLTRKICESFERFVEFDFVLTYPYSRQSLSSYSVKVFANLFSTDIPGSYQQFIRKPITTRYLSANSSQFATPFSSPMSSNVKAISNGLGRFFFFRVSRSLEVGVQSESSGDFLLFKDTFS